MKSSHVCKHLRTKKMFLPQGADPMSAPENSTSSDTSHCWCNRTLAEAGPDDRQVGMQVCLPLRTCYEE